MELQKVMVHKGSSCQAHVCSYGKWSHKNGPIIAIIYIRTNVAKYILRLLKISSTYVTKAVAIWTPRHYVKHVHRMVKDSLMMRQQ